MKKYLLLMLLLPLVAKSQTIPHTINTAISVPVPIYYAATPWILFSTPTSAQVSGHLLRPDGVLKPFSITGSYTLTTNAKDKWIRIGLPSSDFDTLGAYTVIISASFAQQWARGIMVYAAQARNEQTYGVGARIASATALDTANHVSTRSMIGNWAKNATDTIISTRNTIGSWIASASAPFDIIPASGTTLPVFSGQWDGDISRPYLMGFAFSRSENTPEFICRLVQDDGIGVPLLSESSFVHDVYPYNTAILGATAYVHGWKADISGLPLNMQFTVMTMVERNGEAIAGTSKLIKNPTPVIDTSDVMTASLYASTIDDVTTALNAIRLEEDSYTVYRAPYGLERATPGESSQNSRYVPAGGVYAFVKVAGSIGSATYIIDHDSVTEGRSKIYSIDSISAQMAIDGVTMVVTAGEEGGI